MNGIPIPTLCHQQNETPVGVCRVCVVDVGRRVLAASCVRPAENGMVVTTNSDKVRERAAHADRTADGGPSQPLRPPAPIGRLRTGNAGPAGRHHRAALPEALSPRGQDDSSLVIAVDHEACILCDRCIRGCDEIRHNDVLARRGKGFKAGIAFDHQPAHGQLVLRLLRRVHGFLPHRRADQQERRAKRCCPAASRWRVEELKQLPFFQKVPERSSN